MLAGELTCGQVADFGISTLKPQHTQTMTVVGSPIYTAPEVLGEGKYSEKADVYSFGMLLLMCTGHAIHDATRRENSGCQFELVESRRVIGID